MRESTDQRKPAFQDFSHTVKVKNILDAKSKMVIPYI